MKPLLPKLIAQVKRELIEYKISLVYTPLVLSVLSLLLAIGGAYYVLMFKVDEIPTTTGMHEGILSALYANYALLAGVYFWVLVNYLTSCLYDDRKSKQILFWQSMPVSETWNVIGKLFVVMVFAPVFLVLINLVMAALFTILAFVFKSVVDIEIGMDFPSLGSGHVFIVPFEVGFDNLFGALYLLPFIGYFLLISAWVKRFPFIIALGVPMVLTFIDFLLNQIDLSIGVMSAIKLYANVWRDIYPTLVLQSAYQFQVEHLPVLLISILVGVVFIMASIWLRNNRHEI